MLTSGVDSFGIDMYVDAPENIINNYGADAVRFALTTGNSPGKDMRLNEHKLEASRNFANKL